MSTTPQTHTRGAFWLGLATGLAMAVAAVPARGQAAPGSPAALAEPSRFQLGLRFDAVGGSGEPSNDMLGFGAFARYRLSERWRAGLAVDHSPGYDVERPYELVGLVADPALEDVDADATSTAVLVFAERVWPRPGRFEWFVGVGGGFATVDVDDVSGPLGGGATYDITQEVGTELLLVAHLGGQVRLGERWALEAALRFDRHFTDWQVTDRRSGRVAEVDDYLIKGGHLGVALRF